MLPTLYAELVIVALISILVSDVYSQAQDCGIVPNPTDKRTNAEGSWPWMVAITKKSRDGSYDHWCNGFLIDRRHMLTTAHCFYRKYDVHDFLTRIGNRNQDEGEAYEIACITIHPRYKNGQVYSDIAIVTLSRDVLTPNYTPICLPDYVLSGDRLNGIVTTKTAWASDSPGGEIKKTLLQSSGVRVISNRECNVRLRQLVPSFRRQFPYGINSELLCTPTGESKLCTGSSGGPLMYQDDKNRWIAVGIITFAYGCGDRNPEGYTRVSNYVRWIMENTRDTNGDCS